jgi:hypothetical protein
VNVAAGLPPGGVVTSKQVAAKKVSLIEVIVDRPGPKTERREQGA